MNLMVAEAGRWLTGPGALPSCMLLGLGWLTPLLHTSHSAWRLLKGEALSQGSGFAWVVHLVSRGG